MRRDINGVRAAFQGDFQQIPAVQPQNGPPIAVQVANSFQAVGRGVYSLIISLCRQLIVLLPAAWLLSRISLDAIWWSFLIAEAVSMTLSLIFFRKLDRETISRM